MPPRSLDAPPPEAAPRGLLPAAETIRPATPLRRFGGPALLAALFLVLYRWSRGTWPDLLVDFGRELYVAWRLLEGDVLYRDVAYFNGPLSPHWNALWFRIGGVGIATLSLVNAVLLAGLCALVHRLLARIGSRLGAASGVAVLLAVFGFGQYGGIGNYNFISPYSHEATHGLLLALGALGALHGFASARAAGARGTGWLFASALLLGLCFLTKAEVFLAAALAVPLGWVLVVRSSAGTARSRVATLGLASLGFVAVPLVAWLALAARLPWSTALRGTLGTWPYVLAGRGSELLFYREGLVGAGVGSSLAAIATQSLALAALLFPGLWAAWSGLRSRGAQLGLFAAAVLVSAVLRPYVDWYHVARPLPLLAALVLAASLRARRRARGLEADAVLRFAFAVFALALLAKMCLNARVVHYGFVLALPATMLVVVAGVDLVPAALERGGRAGAAFRAWALGLLLVFAAGHLWISAGWFERKHQTLERGADSLRADERLDAVEPALRELERRMQPGETLVVLPEGVMLNYLLRRANSTPYNNFIPSELAFFGEAPLREALEERPPDFVALVHRDTTEYGARFFGRDYARELAAWVERNYAPVASFGAPPFTSEAFGLVVLERTREPR